MRSRVSADGRVTIPAPLRRRLGIEAGQLLDLDVEEGRLVATKSVTHDPVASAYGILREPGSTDDFVAEIRGGATPP